jgi:septal ring factor EnvC (AmiA/AmiB activator)
MSTHTAETPTSFDLVITGSGLESDSQLAIKTAFNPFWLQAMDWQAKVETVTDPKIARESRLLLKKIRVEAGHKKDEIKAALLKQTRAIDGAFKAIETTIAPMESKLDEIEKAEERRIAAAKAALKAERDAALRQYGVDPQWVQTGEMSDAQFLQMLDQAKTAHDAKIEAARIAKEKAEAEAKAAEEARVAKAKADAEERERMRLENERLRKEAEAREAAAKVGRERIAKERAAEEAKAAAERKKLEAKAAEERKAREAAEAEAARIRREAEEKAKAERLAREAAAKAPDKAKLAALAESIRDLVLPDMASAEGKRAVAHAQGVLFDLAQTLTDESEDL